MSRSNDTKEKNFDLMFKIRIGVLYEKEKWEHKE